MRGFFLGRLPDLLGASSDAQLLESPLFDDKILESGECLTSKVGFLVIMTSSSLNSSPEKLPTRGPPLGFDADAGTLPPTALESLSFIPRDFFVLDFLLELYFSLDVVASVSTWYWAKPVSALCVG